MRRTWIATVAGFLFSSVVAWCEEPQPVHVEERFVAGEPVLTSRMDCVDFLDPASCDSVVPGHWLSEKPLKGIAFGPDRWLDVGGSYRARHHREINMRPGAPGGLSGVDDSFWLHQTRLWFDGELNSRLRFRDGFIDAASSG